MEGALGMNKEDDDGPLRLELQKSTSVRVSLLKIVFRYDTNTSNNASISNGLDISGSFNFTNFNRTRWMCASKSFFLISLKWLMVH
jgi:hypothetical protein